MTKATKITVFLASLLLMSGCSQDSVKTCVPGTWSCVDNNVMRCDDGSYVIEHECTGDTPICDISIQRCVSEAGECSDSCRSGILTICKDSNTAAVMDCASQNMVCGFDESTEKYSCIAERDACDSNKEIYAIKDQRCICNEKSNWIGEVGACVCDAYNGYTEMVTGEKSVECVKKALCNSNERYDAKTNSCSCDTSNGWQGEHGKCVCERESCAISNGSLCPSNQHESSEGCEDDSVENCGAHGRDCSVIVDGWVKGTCEEGECVPEECKPDMHIYGSMCEENSLVNCGEHGNECRYTVLGWRDGECTDGVCVPSECANKLHVYEEENVCEYDSVYACGEHGNDCSESVSGWKYGVCMDAECYALACNMGKHAIEGFCEDDTVEMCGAKLINCTRLVGWKDGDCKDGTCNATACKSRYHLKVDETSGNGKCVRDTGECCGDECVNCTEQGLVCRDGVCADPEIELIDKDHVKFGKYEQDSDPDNGPESVVWIIMYNEGFRFLLLAEKILDTQKFHDAGGTVKWKNSSIRTWLNSTFINAVFTASEKKRVLDTTIIDTSNGYDYVNDTTYDKIFLFSDHDAETYFNNNIDRRGDATRYAVRHELSVIGSLTGRSTVDGSCVDPKCWGAWWLRSSGNGNGAKAMIVKADNGDIDMQGKATNTEHIGVRPSLWVNSVCNTGYHYTEDGLCAEDSALMCGSTNCTQLPYWFMGDCIDGVCVPTECQKGAHLYTAEDGTITCEKDDKDNCGKHGNSCRPDMVCVNATCQCPDGTKDCSGACVSVSTPENCGGCGNVCRAGLACINHSCSCTEEEKKCGDDCVILRTDINNCGDCGKKCEVANAACVDGNCDCAEGYTKCGDGESYACFDTVHDSNNCGTCGKKCEGGQFCAPDNDGKGACQCKAGESFCGGKCTVLESDPENCGACGNNCGIGKWSCVSSVCACDGAGLTNCGANSAGINQCVDLKSDDNNCGECGTTCHVDTGEHCNNGSCVVTE